MSLHHYDDGFAVFSWAEGTSVLGAGIVNRRSGGNSDGKFGSVSLARLCEVYERNSNLDGVWVVTGKRRCVRVCPLCVMLTVLAWNASLIVIQIDATIRLESDADEFVFFSGALRIVWRGG